MKKTPPQGIIYRFIIAQAVITVILALLLWWMVSFKAGYSVIVAGIICVLSNGYFTWCVFRYQGARAARQFLTAFCLGEVIKLLMQGFLFVLALLFLNIALGPFLFGFIVNLLIFWLAPFIQFGLMDSKKDAV